MYFYKFFFKFQCNHTKNGTHILKKKVSSGFLVRYSKLKNKIAFSMSYNFQNLIRVSFYKFEVQYIIYSIRTVFTEPVEIR